MTQLMPKAIARRLDAFWRDVATVKESLSGRHPPPLVARRAVAMAPSVSSLLSPRALRVVEVVKETADAVTLVLEDPTGAPFSFSPGQFFTVIADVDGSSLRRAYSASSSALEPRHLSLTAKRVAGGKMSTWLNERVTRGAVLSVLGPSGSFVTPLRADAPRHLVLIAGGSGITPLMSIARTLLVSDPRATLSLVYASRSAADVIFSSDLRALAADHADRLALRFVYGLLDRDVAARELALVDVHLDRATDFYVCGPEAMMLEVRAALAMRGVADARVHEERFTSPRLRSAPANDDGLAPQPITIRMRGAEHRVVVRGGRTVLEAGLDAGVPMPFSCAMGGCGACKVKLVEGDVVMDEPTCLTSEEQAAGYVLACVARPSCAAVVEVP